MLKLTRRTEYSLIALRHIQSVEKDSVVSTREISERCDIPYPLLAKILQELARKGIIQPVQGPRGGYRLKAKLESITLREFFETMEGPLGIMDCYFDSNCEIVGSCTIRLPVERINRTMRNMLEGITVSDIVEG
ncbi:MAG: RrF2 family transcriptional regulator [Fidelibacterota bacterium]